MKSGRQRLKTLGVFARNYLRETGFARMREDVALVLFSEPECALHRLADYSCPVPTLDAAEGTLLDAVKAAKRREIPFDGFLSTRDWNVLTAGMASKRYGRPRHSPSLSSLRLLQSKGKTRRALNRLLPKALHVPVQFEQIERDTSRAEFDRRLRRLLKHGKFILKPDAGSCSYFIKVIGSVADLPAAWRHFRSARNFRGGNFVAERQILGKEYPVDTLVCGKTQRILIGEYLPREPGKFFEVGIVLPALVHPTVRAAMERLSTEIHRRLKLDGIVTHIEMIITDDGRPAVVEINPRLAGDLMQELYWLVHGIDFYRIAARIATGQNMPKDLIGNRGKFKSAIIRFHPPTSGIIKLSADPASFLVTPYDRIGFIAPVGSVLTGGDTNDDRPAYVLLAGDCREELERRAGEALSCIRVERS